MNIKVLMPVFLSCSLAFANSNISQNIIESGAYGEKTITESPLEDIFSKENQETNYRAEVILSWQKLLHANSVYKPETIGKANPFVVALQEQPKEEAKKDIAENKETVVVKGFCYIPNDINVGKQPSAIRAECETNVGSITMFADLVNVNEKASLIADPKYIEAKGVRFNVTSSIVTNEAKTSYNIATYVNDRKIAQISWSSLSVSADEVKKSTNEYLKALRESQTKQEVQYATTTDGAGNAYMQPIQITNTEKPDPLDYLIDAGINVVASTVKTTADIFKADLPYLYQIVGKSKIWIDLKVEKNGVYVK